VEHLKGFGADTVIMGEREIARGIVETVLQGRAEPTLAGDDLDPGTSPAPGAAA